MLNGVSNLGARLCLVVLVLFAVSACTALPRPFQSTKAMPPNLLVLDGASDGVEIEIIEGPSLPMANLLSGSVASELGKLGVPAIVGRTGTSRYILKGNSVRTLNEPDSPYVVKIHWQLLQQNGALVNEYIQGIKGSEWEWDYGSPKIVRETGLITAAMVVEMINGASRMRFKQPIEAGGSQQAALPVNTVPQVIDIKSLDKVKQRLGEDTEQEVIQRTAVWIAPVTGAPSDGNLRLTTSINGALRGSGVGLVKDKAQSTHSLQGKVRLTPVSEDVKQIEIIWTLLRPDGSEFGRATQKNNMPNEMLNGPWRQMATVIASAARQGILDVIDSSRQDNTSVGFNKEGIVVGEGSGSTGLVLPLPSLELE